MAEKARERRAFTAEFKVEAVRRVAERRAAGAPMTQIARELDVRDDLLRERTLVAAAARRAGRRPRRRRALGRVPRGRGARRVAVRAAHRNSHRGYGAPRVHQALRAAGTRVVLDDAVS